MAATGSVTSSTLDSIPLVTIKTDRKGIIFDKFFAPLEVMPTLMPYRLVKELSTRCLKSTMLAVMNRINPTYRNTNDKELTTACINTATMLALIFFGEKKAEMMVKRLRKNSTSIIPIAIDDKNSVTIKVTNLFDGFVIYHMNNNPEDFDALEKDTRQMRLAQYVTPLYKHFQETISPAIQEAVKTKNQIQSQIALFNFFRKMNYDFNTAIFMEIQNQISENIPQVTLERSFGYCVNISLPLSMNYKGYTNELVGSKHIFFIEQFLAGNEVRYRLYQSMVEDATILQDFQARKYADAFEGTWDLEELTQFLHTIEKRYSRAVELDTTQKKPSFHDCFGYHDGETPLYTFDGEALIGLSFRFFSSSFNPLDCAQNLQDFIDSDHQLKEEVSTAFS